MKSRKSKTRNFDKGRKTNLAYASVIDIATLFSVNLRWLIKDSDFKVVIDDKESLKRFISWLEKLSSIDWDVIAKSSRKGLGWEKIEKSSVNTAIPTDFVGDTYISFHWWGHRSILGVRKEGVFCPFSIELNPADNKNYNHS